MTRRGAASATPLTIFSNLAWWLRADDVPANVDLTGTQAVEAFAGVATVTAHAWRTTEAPADLISSHDVKVTGQRGLTVGERGPLLPAGHEGYIPSGGWTAQWFFQVAIVGSSALGTGTASNLSAGKLRVYFRTERAPG